MADVEKKTIAVQSKTAEITHFRRAIWASKQHPGIEQRGEPMRVQRLALYREHMRFE